MKESVYTAYEDLPLFLNAETVAKLLGISISSSYELMHEKGFPSLRIGSRLIVPKEKFRAWVEEKTGGSILNSPDIQSVMRSEIIFHYRTRFSVWVSVPARSQCMRI